MLNAVMVLDTLMIFNIEQNKTTNGLHSLMLGVSCVSLSFVNEENMHISC